MKKNMKLHCLNKINRVAKLFATLKKVAYEKNDHEVVQECKKNQILLYLVKSLTMLDLEASGEIKRTQRVAEPSGYLLQEFNYVDDDGAVRSLHSPSQKQTLEENECPAIFRGRMKKENGLHYKVNSENATEIYGEQEKKIIYLPYLNYLIKNLSPGYKMVYDFISEDISPMYSEEKHDSFFKLLESCNIRGEVVDCHSYHYTDYTQFRLNLYGNGIKLCPYEIIFNDMDQDDLVVAADENGFLYCDMWVG